MPEKIRERQPSNARVIRDQGIQRVEKCMHCVFPDQKQQGQQQRDQQPNGSAYRVAQNGKLMDIVDVRDITFDSKFMQLPLGGHNGDFTPQHMREEYDKMMKKLQDQADRDR